MGKRDTNTINFTLGGKLGDFIHELYAVKNICDRDGAIAKVYLSEGRGDVWLMGAKRAYADMKELILQQPYVNSFHLGECTDAFLDLNSWRQRVATTHVETGKYNVSWSDLMSQEYAFNIPPNNSWLIADKDPFIDGCVVIHESLVHDSSLPWKRVFDMPCKRFVFITSNQAEWDKFKHKDKVDRYFVTTVTHMARAINSCKLFIGNQSAPLAIACALDVPRIAILNPDPAPFYMGEEVYSDNFMWYLNEECKYIGF